MRECAEYAVECKLVHGVAGGSGSSIPGTNLCFSEQPRVTALFAVFSLSYTLSARWGVHAISFGLDYSTVEHDPVSSRNLMFGMECLMFRHERQARG